MGKGSAQRIRPGKQRGDTIIEVLLAIGILGVLVTVTYTVMSRSLAMTYNSLDRTNTQAVINGQVNMLRAIHAQYINSAATAADKQKWQSIVANATRVNASEDPSDKAKRNSGCTFGTSHTNAFYLNPADLTVSDVDASRNIRQPTTGSLPVPGDGLWIEGYEMTRDSGNNIIDNVYTFYVKACTSPIYGDGSDVNRETKTAVRLYAP